MEPACAREGCEHPSTSYGRYCRCCATAAQRASNARKRDAWSDEWLRAAAALGEAWQ